MNRFKNNILVAAAVLGLGSAAFAAPEAHMQSGGQDQGHARVHKHGEMKKELMAKRHAELREKLKLTSAQEAAWNSFTSSMSAPARNAKHLSRTGWESLSAPERMEKMLEKAKQRQNLMAARLSAVKVFYAQLSPEQQKIFNDNFARSHRFERRGASS